LQKWSTVNKFGAGKQIYLCERIIMKLISILLFPLLFIACQKYNPPRYSAQQIDSLKHTFQTYLISTEHDFKTADWSPLTAEDRKTFTHLHYYPYDITWRFEGPIHRYTRVDSIKIRGSKAGDVRPAVRYGYFEFEKDGQKFRLQIIKILPTEPGRKAHLFLGFWDETSDVETYGGGRYIDIEEHKQNRYIVDFNYAYNPYCAYSDRYSCAIPPFENRLKIAVRAGEKIYKEH